LSISGFERVAEVMIVKDAGGVAEELADGDVMPLSGKVGEILPNVVVEGELAAFDLLHNSYSGEREHRADDVIDGVRVRGCLESYVGYTVTFEQEDLIAFGDQHRGSYYLCLCDSLSGNGVEIRLRGVG
jgi:hypothetical protein